MFRFFVNKTYNDVDLAPIVELRYGIGIFSYCVAEYDKYTKAYAVAKKLNQNMENKYERRCNAV